MRPVRLSIRLISNSLTAIKHKKALPDDKPVNAVIKKKTYIGLMKMTTSEASEAPSFHETYIRLPNFCCAATLRHFAWTQPHKGYLIWIMRPVLANVPDAVVTLTRYMYMPELIVGRSSDITRSQPAFTCCIWEV